MDAYVDLCDMMLQDASADLLGIQALGDSEIELEEGDVEWLMKPSTTSKEIDDLYS